MTAVSIYLAPALFSMGILMIAWKLVGGMLSTRRTRLAALRNLRIKPKWMAFLHRMRESEERTPSGIKLKAKLKLAGSPWGITVIHYQLFKLSFFLFVTGCLIILILGKLSVNLGALQSVLAPYLIRYMIVVAVGWFLPDLWISIIANRRKTLLLFEISKLSHRLVLCITDKMELREVILRAGRTLTVLKPYLNEMSLNWHKNQHEAILTLGHQVGITEIYPLVNTLTAVSNVESSEVAKMLEQQIDNIDKTLEHEIQKKIENAPLYIVFLIMVPFFVVFVLMIYPWIVYLTDQLSTSFGGGM